MRRSAIWCGRVWLRCAALRQARQQLSGFLLRHGHHYNRPAWTQMHRRWLAGLTLRAGGPPHRPGGLHRGGRGGDGPARSAGGTDRGDAAGLVAGAGGAGAAGAARHGAGGGGDAGRRTRRHHPLRQSAAADGLSRAGPVRAFQRRHAASGRRSPRPGTERPGAC